MATSVVPQNRVEMLASEGLSEIPAGWAIRSDGSAATDPEAFDALLPVGGREKSTGGHKGTALAALVEAMTAVLSGAWRLHEVADIMEDDPCAPPPPPSLPSPPPYLHEQCFLLSNTRPFWNGC